MAASRSIEAFPPVSIEMTSGPAAIVAASPSSPVSPVSPATPLDQERRFSNNSLPRRLSRTFMESDLPLGFMAATADMTSSVLVAGRTRSSTTRTRSSVSSDTGHQSSMRGEDQAMLEVLQEQRASASIEMDRDSRRDGHQSMAKSEDETTGSSRVVDQKDPGQGDVNVGMNGRQYPNGYHFPPQYSKSESTRHAAVAFWKYVRTPVGFLVVLYGLNVVAWGGMLFLLLCNASPAMCHPTCNDINSPRRVWIEIDSQILNALFCVTGFGLAPWRLRDLFYLLRFRLAQQPATKQLALRRLAGVHRGWLRLPGSETLPADVGPGNIRPDTPEQLLPFPVSKVPDAPLTGERAPPTTLWHIDFVLWMNAGNTFLQCVLSGFMWGMNRYDRPSWSTGLFVALGCCAGAIGGLGMFVEGKRVKSVEGVPLTEEDYAKLAQDREQGIHHYNNIKGKKPKEKGSRGGTTVLPVDG